MDFQEFIKKAKELRAEYDKLCAEKKMKIWGLRASMQGFVVDVGKLMELIMAKEGFKKIDDVDKKLEHELANCLWCVIVIADYLDIDLEKAFFTMIENELNIRIPEKRSE